MKVVNILVGPSGSGKDYAVKVFRLSHVVSSTTRKKRQGDIDNVTHKFTTAEQHKKKIDAIKRIIDPTVEDEVLYNLMMSNDIAATTEYHGSYYWASWTDLRDDKITSFVVDVDGVQQMLRCNELHLKKTMRNSKKLPNDAILFNIVWFSVPVYKRFYRMLKRGNTIKFALSRIINDYKVFKLDKIQELVAMYPTSVKSFHIVE